jgi:hypothetical protein
MRTWASGFEHVYFVIEYSAAASQEFNPSNNCNHEKVVNVFEEGDRYKEGNHVFRNTQSVVKCADNKHPVLLVECTNAYWGSSGPCCKFEEAIKFVTSSMLHAGFRDNYHNNNKNKNNNNSFCLFLKCILQWFPFSLYLSLNLFVILFLKEKEFDWVVFSDDDMYYDPLPFTMFLKKHDPSIAQIMGPNLPLSPFSIYPSRTHCRCNK